MITINTDKGLIKVNSWEDIESRPGFVKDLNPNNKKLDSIIGRYIFNYKTPCGLSNCHTGHNKGFIVSTVDGFETNIGKDCGTKYFGVDFDTLSKKLERDITESEYRNTLWNFFYKIDELEETIDVLLNEKHGAKWVNKMIQPLITQGKGCPNQVINQLYNMVKIRSNLLTVSRVALEKEVSQLEEIEQKKYPRPHYILVPISEISGIESLYPENNLRELLIIDLETNIKALKNIDIDQMSYKELNHWSKWVGTVESTIDQSKSIIKKGRKLLNFDNLESFIKIINDQKDIKLFQKYIRRIEKKSG